MDVNCEVSVRVSVIHVLSNLKTVTKLILSAASALDFILFQRKLWLFSSIVFGTWVIMIVTDS